MGVGVPRARLIAEAAEARIRGFMWGLPHYPNKKGRKVQISFLHFEKLTFSHLCESRELNFVLSKWLVPLFLRYPLLSEESR